MHAERQTLDVLARLFEVVENLVSKMLGDIVANKVRRDLENRYTVGYMGKLKRLDPVGKIAFPNRPFQRIQHIGPNVVCHFCFCPQNLSSLKRPIDARVTHVGTKGSDVRFASSALTSHTQIETSRFRCAEMRHWKQMAAMGP
jgi:hypothetical protein